MIAPWLFYSTLIGGLLCLVSLLGERIARLRHQSSRRIWAVAIGMIVLVPVILNLIPHSPTTAAPDRSLAHATSPLVAQTAIVMPALSDTLVLVLWGLASLLLVARIVGTALVLRRRSERWERADLAGATVLLADDLGPALIGWRKFTTVLPRWALTFDEESRSLMLEHEAEHARTGDPYLRGVALAALVLMPWNPALWWAMRRLRLAVEMDCDQRLLRRGVDPHKYASLLLAVGARMSATPFAWATALGGSPSSLELRIVAMLSPFRPRHPRLAIAALNAVVLAVVIVACASPVPDPLVPLAAPATTERAKPTEVATNRWVADTFLFVCKDGPEVRADTSCAKERVAYVTYRVTNSEAGGDLELQEPRDGAVIGQALANVKEDRAYQVTGDDQASTKPSTRTLGNLVVRSDAREEPSVVLQNTTPKCTAAQLPARLHAKAGEFWPRCEP